MGLDVLVCNPTSITNLLLLCHYIVTHTYICQTQPKSNIKRYYTMAKKKQKKEYITHMRVCVCGVLAW